jgi:hypothetical protein
MTKTNSIGEKGQAMNATSSRQDKRPWEECEGRTLRAFKKTVKIQYNYNARPTAYGMRRVAKSSPFPLSLGTTTVGLRKKAT